MAVHGTAVVHPSAFVEEGAVVGEGCYIGPFAVIGPEVVLGARDKRWAVELWGRNLTDRTYSQVGFDAPIQTGSWNAFLGAPRTYGVTLRFMF